MHQIVCVKQVPDPETPSSLFRVDPVANKVVPAPGIAPVMSPFDEQALEVALRIKDKHGGNITVISMGPSSVRDVLKHGLAMGADDAVQLTDPAFEGADHALTAYVLAQAIKRLGAYDIIHCGRQAADSDGGQVGLGIAELLGHPVLINGQGADLIDGRVRFERVMPNGISVYESPTPVVLTYSQEVGQPRYPTLRNIMTAARKEVPLWGSQDLGADPSRLGPQGHRTRLTRLFIPTFEGECEIIEGESAAQSGELLALKLREARII